MENVVANFVLTEQKNTEVKQLLTSSLKQTKTFAFEQSRLLLRQTGSLESGGWQQPTNAQGSPNHLVEVKVSSHLVSSHA